MGNAPAVGLAPSASVVMGASVLEVWPDVGASEQVPALRPEMPDRGAVVQRMAVKAGQAASEHSIRPAKLPSGAASVCAHSCPPPVPTPGMSCRHWVRAQMLSAWHRKTCWQTASARPGRLLVPIGPPPGFLYFFLASREFQLQGVQIDDRDHCLRSVAEQASLSVAGTKPGGLMAAEDEVSSTAPESNTGEEWTNISA